MKDIWDLGLTLSYVPLHQQCFKGHRFAASGAVKVPDPVPVVPLLTRFPSAPSCNKLVIYMRISTEISLCG